MVLSSIERRSNSLNELLTRLNSYGLAFHSLSNSAEAKLIIFASYTRKSTEIQLQKNFPYLEIYSVKAKKMRLIRQALQLSKLIKVKGNQRHLLIAGDPIEGFLITLLVKMQSFGRNSVQVQFHGDIYLRPQKINFKEYLRWILARIQYSVADSVRVVSPHQLEDLYKISKKKSKKIFVAAIPIDPIFFKADLNKYRNSVGFIGRLHIERGVDMLKPIIATLLAKYPEVKFLIIGDGPEKEKFIEEFKNDLLNGRISILGWLSKHEVLSELENMKILISTAPREGYGLAIREAIMAGVCVVATSNPGAHSALKDFPDLMRIYQNLENAVLAVDEFIDAEIPMHSVELARKIQYEKDRLGIEMLVQSWISSKC